MGRDLLAQDYILKQVAASLIYPDDKVGKKFWNRIYSESVKRFNTTNIPVNTFNKVWIIPDKTIVYEDPRIGAAYIIKAKLKVMLEQDYLALSKNNNQVGKINTNQFASQIAREIIIPELTKEVNEGKNFSTLRQIYQSLILARWYKKKIKNSILHQVYLDRNKISGIDIYSVLNKQTNKQTNPSLSLSGLTKSIQSRPIDPQQIYQQYIQAFKKGVYNFIKEERDPVTQRRIPRKYFSGGVNFFGDFAIVITAEGNSSPKDLVNDAIVESRLDVANRMKRPDDGLDILRSLMLKPVGYDFSKFLEENPGFIGLEIGTTNSHGSISFQIQEKWPSFWSILGTEEEGYKAVVATAKAYF